MPDIWASKSLIPTPGQVRRWYCGPERRILYGKDPAWRGGSVRHCALVAAGRCRLCSAAIPAGAAGGLGGPGPAQSRSRPAGRQLGGGNLLRGQVHHEAGAFRGDQRGVGLVRTPVYIRHRSAYTTGGDDDVGAGWLDAPDTGLAFQLFVKKSISVNKKHYGKDTVYTSYSWFSFFSLFLFI